MAFKDVLAKSFPFITAAASLGGPLGTMAAQAVGTALGLSKDKHPEPTIDGITTAVATAFADPQQRAAIIQAEQNFQKQMAELGYQHAEELEQTAAADRANARQREMTLKDKIPALLAILVTLGFFGVLAFMLFRQVPSTGHDALLLMLGALGSAWTAVVAYYFGSSAGSDRKTELMAAEKQ